MKGITHHQLLYFGQLYNQKNHLLKKRLTHNLLVADRASHEEVKYINLSPLTAPVKTQPVYSLTTSKEKYYADSKLMPLLLSLT